MSDNPPLIVPVDVQALLVNSKVRAQNFQRWTMNYNNLFSYSSPEPLPFAGNDLDWGTTPANDGIWLHWRLPAALRHGQHDTVDSTTTWPLVPNRWAVIRFGPAPGQPAQRAATGWVIESDYVDQVNGTSAFIDPTAPDLTVTRIGRMVPLPWSETNSKPLFLTGIGPGNVNFASYQPYVNNVFSMHDPVTGIPEGSILSYLVVGWFSDPAADILVDWKGLSFVDYIATLGWTVSQNADSSHVSVYEGIVYGVTWQTTTAPTSGKPTPDETLVAIGNTSIDALTAMVAKESAGDPTIDAELLQAFQYDLVRMLDEPNGQLLVDRAIYQAWFGQFKGGYVWEIVAANTPSSSEALTINDKHLELGTPDWLYQLNQDQYTYDSLVEQLSAAQFNLYQVWWKKGKAAPMNPYPYGITPEEMDAAFDPQNTSGLVYQVNSLMAQVTAAQANIPWGDTQDGLAASIVQYSQAHSLPSTQQLKRSDRRQFYDSNDPVMCIYGANAQAILEEPTPLPCRFPNQIVAGFTYNGQQITASSVGYSIPSLNTQNLPSVTPAMITELFFVDPNDAALVAQSALGTSDPAVIQAVYDVMAAHNTDFGTPASLATNPPALITAWTQPWSPLFLMWQVQFYPILFGTNADPNWTFDGTNYTWTGNGAQTDASNLRVLNGRIFLTPQSSFNFKARMDQYLNTYPDADLAAVEQFITDTLHWDFLSQAMTGFNDELILQDPMALLSPDSTTVFYPPNTTLATLVGSGAVAMPQPGVSQPYFGEFPPSGFQEFRSGQFFFEKIFVVDRFGQNVEIVNDQTFDQFIPIIGDGLVPDKKVLPIAPQKWLQVTPRILQPARLDLDFVSATNDSEILNLDAGVNPICAWVLPNHIDHALNCYDPAGVALGEAYIILNEQQQYAVMWFPAPFSEYTTIASLQPDFPHLAEFLSGVQTAGPAAFDAMLKVIDETLWTIDPLGTRDDQYLSVLVGRPLALVRSLLQYELDGPAASDPSWRFSFTPDPPDTTTYNFPVRLGDLALRDDGLIGYFVNSDYNTFNCVNIPSGVTSSYVKLIGPGNFLDMEFNTSSQYYLTMFVDPRAGVHAFTDLLPVTGIEIPQEFVDTALSNMQVTFNIGPVIGELSNEVVQEQTNILMPLPAEKTGTWSWVQIDGSTPTPYNVMTVDQTAQFSNVPPVLRSGWLQLSSAMMQNLQKQRRSNS